MIVEQFRSGGVFGQTRWRDTCPPNGGLSNLDGEYTDETPDCPTFTVSEESLRDGCPDENMQINFDHSGARLKKNSEIWGKWKIGVPGDVILTYSGPDGDGRLVIKT